MLEILVGLLKKVPGTTKCLASFELRKNRSSWYMKAEACVERKKTDGTGDL